MKKFAVFGNPIAQSLSPSIHQMFAEQCGELITYSKILASEEGFAEAVHTFFSDSDAMGCNITMPFKQQAYALAKVDDQAARDARAVNTLMRNHEGTLSGFNTDGIGLVNDLLNHGVTLTGARVLLIGAGGAARGVISPLLQAGVGALCITNRTVAKAERVAEETSNGQVSVIAPESCAEFKPTVIINSTAASLSGGLPLAMTSELLASCHTTYDMVYTATTTPFNEAAEKGGVPTTLDGLGMLVEQAAAAFAIWTGEQPATRAVLTALRKQITGA